jgi:hypothetical protein
MTSRSAVSFPALLRPENRGESTALTTCFRSFSFYCRVVLTRGKLGVPHRFWWTLSSDKGLSIAGSHVSSTPCRLPHFKT